MTFLFFTSMVFFFFAESVTFGFLNEKQDKAVPSTARGQKKKLVSQRKGKERQVYLCFSIEWEKPLGR